MNLDDIVIIYSPSTLEKQIYRMGGNHEHSIMSLSYNTNTLLSNNIYHQFCPLCNYNEGRIVGNSNINNSKHIRVSSNVEFKLELLNKYLLVYIFIYL